MSPTNHPEVSFLSGNPQIRCIPSSLAHYLPIEQCFTTEKKQPQWRSLSTKGASHCQFSEPFGVWGNNTVVFVKQCEPPASSRCPFAFWWSALGIESDMSCQEAHHDQHVPWRSGRNVDASFSRRLPPHAKKKEEDT